jgi:two-component system, NarL family, sensor kinase
MTQPKRNHYLAFIFSVFTSLLLLMNCQKKEDTSVIFENDTEKWLGKSLNFEKDAKTYKKRFWSYYDSVATKNDFQKQGKVLAIYGKVLWSAFSSDGLFTKTVLNHISKPNPKPDSVWIQLHYYASCQLFDTNKYQESKLCAMKGISFCDSPQYESFLAQFKKLIGRGFSEQAKPDSAISYYIQALPIAEKNQNYKMLGSIYYNIGYCYDILNAYNESRKMYFKASDNFLKAKDTISTSTLLATIGVNELYYTTDTAYTLRLIDSSMIIYNMYKGRTPSDSAWANETLAYKYFYLKQYDLAKHHLDKSIKYFISSEDVGARVYLKDHYILDSKIFFKKYGKLKDPRKTEQWANEMKVNKQYSDATSLYNQLYQSAKNKKDYESANKYLLIVNSLNDSIMINNQKGQIFELDRKYQTVQKEQQITLQKTEIEQKNTSIALLIASIIGLFFLIFAYYLWQKQKTLKQDKTNSMNFTKQLLENTEDERKRIASDLHDSISHELLNLKSIFKQDLTTVNTKIDSIINDIRGISRNLHPVMFDKIGLEPNIEQLVERIQQQNDFMVSTDINYKGSLTSADELQIYRVIQEALTNIIKYAKAHAGKITIEENQSSIFIEIKDNGKGFNVTEALNSGKSFGLHNIIERSRVIGGEAKISSSPEGTIININIPKA